VEAEEKKIPESSGNGTRKENTRLSKNAESIGK